jgi:uncharacterized protein
MPSYSNARALSVKRRSAMLIAMKQANAQDSFEDGLELFNQGRLFECHEAWEEVWKSARGTEKVFYQGLIQAAVALLHAERGNFRGAVSTYQKARAKLDRLPAEHMGIALAKFRGALEEFFAATRTGNPLPPRPQIHRRRG